MSLLIGRNGRDQITGTNADDQIIGGNGDDTLAGGAGSDFILGGGGNDLIFGGAGNDLLSGGEGADVMAGGAGSDQLFGGSGTDVAVFDGNRSDYRMTTGGGLLRIQDLRPGGGTDIVQSIERFRFADMEVSLSELLAAPPANQAPIAADDVFEATEEESSVLLDVLANDRDPDAGDTRHLVSIDTDGMAGSALIGSDGLIHYTPPGGIQSLGVGETLVETFRYTMRDAAGLVSTAEVRLTIVGQNNAPVAGADLVTLSENGSHTLDLLANDGDVDGDALTIDAIDTSTTLGSVSVGKDGRIVYTPGAAFQHLAAGETATDAFTYTVRDANGAAGLPVTVSVTVVGADEMEAIDDVVSLINLEGAVMIDSLLANDVGTGLTIVSVAKDGAGEVQLQPDGRVLYQPSLAMMNLAPGESATDSFTYTVRDSSGALSTATANVRITGSDRLSLQTIVQEDAATQWLTEQIIDVFGYGHGHIVSVDASKTVGSVSFDPESGQVTYTADADYFDAYGGDSTIYTSFEVTVTGPSGTVKGIVTVKVEGVSDEPTVIGDVFEIDAGALSGNLAPLLLENDHHPDGEPFTIVGVETIGTIGSVLFDAATGSVVYQAGDAEDYTDGRDSFRYIVRDAQGDIATAEVDVLIDSDGIANAFSAPADLAAAFAGTDSIPSAPAADLVPADCFLF
jgi:VCBS repeat-containing protein